MHSSCADPELAIVDHPLFEAVLAECATIFVERYRVIGASPMIAARIAAALTLFALALIANVGVVAAIS
jgi:hypothetical protein